MRTLKLASLNKMGSSDELEREKCGGLQSEALRVHPAAHSSVQENTCVTKLHQKPQQAKADKEWLENLESLTFSSHLHLEQAMMEIREELRDLTGDWQRRVKAMKRLAQIVRGGAHKKHNSFFASLNSLQEALKTQIQDRRSRVVVKVCTLITYLAAKLGKIPQFWSFMDAVVPELLKLTIQTTAVIAQSAQACLLDCVRLSHIDHAVLELVQEGQSRGDAMRARSLETVLHMIRMQHRSAWEKHLKPLQNLIEKAVRDRSEEVRHLGRLSVTAFVQKCPESSILSTLTAKERDAVDKAHAQYLASAQSSSQSAENSPCNIRRVKPSSRILTRLDNLTPSTTGAPGAKLLKPAGADLAGGKETAIGSPLSAPLRLQPASSPNKENLAGSKLGLVEGPMRVASSFKEKPVSVQPQLSSIGLAGLAPAARAAVTDHDAAQPTRRKAAKAAFVLGHAPPQRVQRARPASALLAAETAPASPARLEPAVHHAADHSSNNNHSHDTSNSLSNQLAAAKLAAYSQAPPAPVSTQPDATKRRTTVNKHLSPAVGSAEPASSQSSPTASASKVDAIRSRIRLRREAGRLPKNDQTSMAFGTTAASRHTTLSNTTLPKREASLPKKETTTASISSRPASRSSSKPVDSTQPSSAILPTQPVAPKRVLPRKLPATSARPSAPSSTRASRIPRRRRPATETRAAQRRPSALALSTPTAVAPAPSSAFGVTSSGFSSSSRIPKSASVTTSGRTRSKETASRAGSREGSRAAAPSPVKQFPINELVQVMAQDLEKRRASLELFEPEPNPADTQLILRVGPVLTAVESLPLLPSLPAVDGPAPVHRLDPSDPENVARFIASLPRQGEEAAWASSVDALLQVLQTGSPGVCKAAEAALATVLENAPLKEALQTLVERVGSNEHVGVLRALLKAFEQMVDRISVDRLSPHMELAFPALLQCMNSPQALVRLRASNCFIVLYRKLGESMFDHLPGLTKVQLRLIRIRIRKDVTEEPATTA
eukprot:g33573.t1